MLSAVCDRPALGGKRFDDILSIQKKKAGSFPPAFLRLR
ncbi:hypothetical protein ABI_22080 [Asticcacaulis biprosthecium C19]|uniref:Uncharacterized protein n=1 Tax=Asticcacaulis biprosthecium C19 TaxID=715226 RepID=F4QH13_9CAUL|nr:hypothetical protein ABI_22080 [Asticcacaulis biprosthecium C19]